MQDWSALPESRRAVTRHYFPLLFFLEKYATQNGFFLELGLKMRYPVRYGKAGILAFFVFARLVRRYDVAVNICKYRFFILFPNIYGVRLF
jgi:hypothetical protein